MLDLFLSKQYIVVMFKIFKKIKDAIMSLFGVNGQLSIDTSNVFINGNKSDLSVRQLSWTEYSNLVKNNACISNVLYVVENDCVDAFNMQIKNVADPTDSQDVVTLGYLKNNFDTNSKYVTKDELSANMISIMKNLLNRV